MKIGIGYAFVFEELSERARLENAENKLKGEYRALSAGLKKSDADIFLWHTAVLNDPFTHSKMLERINGGSDAEYAVISVFDEALEDFYKNDNALIRERAEDVKDIKRSLLRLLSSEKRLDLSALPKGSVLVLNSLSPAAVCKMSSDSVRAIVTKSGSRLSHSAILASSKGIPSVFSAKNYSEIKSGDLLVVDSSINEVQINPYKK